MYDPLYELWTDGIELWLCKTYLVSKFEVSSFKNGRATSKRLNEGRTLKIGKIIKNNPIDRVVLDGRPDFAHSAFI